MQWIDALGYEEVMTFLRQYTGEPLFQGYRMPYLFISDVRTFFPYGEGQEEDVLGKTDLEIWSSEEQARFYYEQDQKVLATGKGNQLYHRGAPEGWDGILSDQKEPRCAGGKDHRHRGAYW